MDSRGQRRQEAPCGEGLVEGGQRGEVSCSFRGLALGPPRQCRCFQCDVGPEEWMQLPGKASDPWVLGVGGRLA